MADPDIVASVILVKLVMLALVLVLAHQTYRAYRRSPRPDIRALSIGFGALATGILLGGGVYQLMHFDIMIGLLVESIFSAFGFGMIVYSICGFE